jgi:hypothetical protein
MRSESLISIYSSKTQVGRICPRSFYLKPAGHNTLADADLADRRKMTAAPLT